MQDFIIRLDEDVSMRIVFFRLNEKSWSKTTIVQRGGALSVCESTITDAEAKRLIAALSDADA